jgi:hypothetical protein
MCLEVSYRNIRIAERWKRNRSDVFAWKYHTEILELQRDVWKRNTGVVCAWKYHTEILEYREMRGREIEVMYVLGGIIQKSLLFVFHTSLCNSNISV